MKDVVVLDVETGGLDCNVHSLLSVGVLFVRNDEVVYKGEWKIKHDTYNVTVGALKVNQINLVEHEKGAYTIDAFRDEYVKMWHTYFDPTEPLPIVMGKNVGFDLGFLHKVFTKRFWEMMHSYRNIDITGIARFLQDTGKIKTSKVNLESLVKELLPEESVENMHSALRDTELTYKVYKAMYNIV